MSGPTLTYSISLGALGICVELFAVVLAVGTIRKSLEKIAEALNGDDDKSRPRRRPRGEPDLLPPSSSK